MRLNELRKINKKYFGYEDIAKILGVSMESAKISASRYVRQGFLVRVKRNIYMLREFWNVAPREEKYLIANLGQTPSYISLSTALDYYEVTTQIQRNFFESIAVKRTKEFSINGSVFRYNKIKNDLYFGFKKEKGFFIATPEKAFLDALYLTSYGRYAIDMAAINAEKLNQDELERLGNKFPLKTRSLLKKWIS